MIDTRPRAARCTAVIGALASAVAGSLVPVQAAINGRLAAGIGSSIGAAAVSMMLSGVVLVPAALWRWHMNSHEAKREGLQAWMFLGGTFGSAYVASLILLTPLLGYAALFVVVEAGSMASAMVLDHIGFAGSRKHLVSPRRVLGVLLPFAGCVVLESGPQATKTATHASGVVALLLGALAGGCKPVQAALNRRLREGVGGTEVAAEINCLVGAGSLASVLLLQVLISEPSMGAADGHKPLWWEWLGGGVLGVAGVVVPVVVGEAIGMAAYFVCNLFGQLGAAAALELSSQAEQATVQQLLRLGAASALGLAGGLLVQEFNQASPSVRLGK